SSIVWGAGGGPPAYADVRLNGDGSIDVLTGAQDPGTGSRTALAQIAAEALGARIDDVRTVLGDTERLPYAPNSWGSITTASVGPAVRVAALEARHRLLEAAAGRLDADIEVLDGRLGVPLNPTMHDYKIPTIADVPSIDAFFVDGADVVANHIGTKGLAEPPIIATAPAIANAVANAIGVEVMEIPLTRWRVLEALSKRGA